MKTESEARKIAYKILCSRYRVILGKSSSKNFHLDMRRKFDKLIYKYICEIRQLINFSEILAKQKVRQKNKPYQFTNVLQNSLYLDYKRNGGRIEVQRLYVHGRNHWAKNEFDLKVLSILNKRNKK